MKGTSLKQSEAVKNDWGLIDSGRSEEPKSAKKKHGGKSKKQEKKRSVQGVTGSFIKSAFMLTGAMLAVKICGMFFKIFLTRIFSVFGDDFAGIGTGLFSNAYEIYIPLFTIATAGFPIAVSKMVSESAAKEDFRQVRKIYKTAKPFFVVTGGVCFLVMFFSSFFYVRLIAQPYAVYSMLTLSPTIFFGCVASVYRGYFEGLRNMKPTAVSQVIESVTKLFVGLGLAAAVVFWGAEEYKNTGGFFGLAFSSKAEASNTLAGISVAAAIGGITLGSIFSCVYLIIKYKASCRDIPGEYYSVTAGGQARISEVYPYTAKGTAKGRKEKKNKTENIERRKTFLKLFRTAIPIGITSLVMSISSTLDSAIIQHVLYNKAVNSREELLNCFGGVLNHTIPLFPSEENPITIHTYLFGCFSCSLTVMQLVTAVTQVLGTCAMPNVTTALAGGRKDELKKSIETVIRITMTVVLPAGLGLFFLSEPIMSLFFSGNVALIGSRVLRIMGLSVVFIASCTPICSMLQAIGKISLPLKFFVLGMAIKIGINYLFVSSTSLNIQGAAVGSLLAYIYIFFGLFYYLCRYSKVKPNLLSCVLKPLISALICCVFAAAIYNLLCGLMFKKIAVLLAIAVSMVVYVFFLLLLRTFSAEEMKIFPGGEKIEKLLEK